MAPSGGSFEIDLERAPQAIKELEAARRELVEIKEHALTLGKVDPGSGDSVSIDVATVLSARAVSGPGSLVAAIEAGIHQLDQLIAEMTADLREHRTNEDTNAVAFRA